MSKKPQLNSKIIRIQNKTLAKLRKFKGSKGGWTGALEAALTDAFTQASWVLPGHRFKTKQAARAEALKNAAKKGLPLEEAERPVKVRHT